MLSFWEKDALTHFDYAVIGGGIVGLSTALSIKEKEPKAEVVVLEAGSLPTGASTKNAGFACFGSLTEIIADLETLSAIEVQDLVSLRWEGLQLLRERLGDTAIDFKNFGGYELLSKDQFSCLDRIPEVNELLRPILKGDVYQVVKDSSQFGFNTNEVSAMIFNPFEGQIHTGKMMKSLQRKVSALGVTILSGTRVREIDEESGGVSISLENFSIKALKVAVCTNAFTKQFFPALALEPGRGAVLVTKPIADLKFKGTFHYDEGYYYFRNYENRVIFGGGRNLDLETENTTAFDVNERILNKLINDLDDFILPNTSYEIEQTWAGIMAFGANKQPILKKVSDRVFAGVRLGGMGVAIGSKLGLELAAKMCA